eukprot:7655112-Pyramimonas_sp.AAC.1
MLSLPGRLEAALSRRCRLDSQTVGEPLVIPAAEAKALLREITGSELPSAARPVERLVAGGGGGEEEEEESKGSEEEEQRRETQREGGGRTKTSSE